MTFVPELNRDLSPGQLAVWSRRGTPECTAKDKRFISLWIAQAKGGKSAKGKSSRRSLPMVACPHLGAATGETVQCRRCKKLAPVETYHCAKHGLCTQHEYPAARNDGGKLVDDVKCCKNCSDNPANAKPTGPVVDREYAGRYPTVGKRHLLYHLLPVAGNGVWQWNVQQLRQRWSQFTGRKLIAVATGDPFRRGARQGERDAVWTLDTVAAVRAELPNDAEVLIVQNDPELREVASWALLVNEIVTTAAPEDVVLYAHAKGVTRAEPPNDWTSWLYELALDYPDKIDALLASHPVAGSFRRDGPAFGGKAPWHYTGTFFWFRAGDMAKRPWRAMPRAWWGVEGWPGMAYGRDEAGVLFGEGGAELDLFKAEVVDRIGRELADWRRS